MPQIFHRSANTIARVSIFGALFFVAGLLYLAYQIDRSPWVTQVNVAREQPIQFSHEHHVDGNGIDCRYCHTTVETSAFAGIPPTKTCMNCHSQIFSTAPMLEPVRESLRTDTSIAWTRVHDLPDFAYFDHSIHVAKGVGCATCHGPVDQMPLMRQAEHAADGVVPRLPSAPGALRAAAGGGVQHGLRAPADQLELGQKLVDQNRIRKMTIATHVTDEARQRAGILADARGTTRRREPRRAGRRRVRFASAEADSTPSNGAAFLKLMGASLALAGMAGCTRQPPEQIVPYVRQPEEIVPGQSAVLRDRDDARRPRDGRARREPRRAADEDRGQPAAPREPRRDRCVRTRRAARSLRSRSHADRDADWAKFCRGPRSSARCARRRPRSRPQGRRVCACSPRPSARRRSPRRLTNCSRASPPPSGISGTGR